MDRNVVTSDIEALIASRQFEEAIDLCHMREAELPGYPQIQALLGRALFATHSFADALEPLRKAISLDPYDWESATLYCQALDRTGNIEEAYRIAQEWRKLKPDHPVFMGLIETLEYRVKGNRSEIWERTRGLTRDVRPASES